MASTGTARNVRSQWAIRKTIFKQPEQTLYSNDNDDSSTYENSNNDEDGDRFK